MFTTFPLLYPTFILQNPAGIEHLKPLDKPVTVDQRMGKYVARYIGLCLINCLCNVAYLMYTALFSDISVTIGHAILLRSSCKPFSFIPFIGALWSTTVGSAIIDLCIILAWMFYIKLRYGRWVGGTSEDSLPTQDENYPLAPFWRMVFAHSIRETALTFVKYFLVGLVGSVFYIVIQTGWPVHAEEKRVMLQVMLAGGLKTLIGSVICWFLMGYFEAWHILLIRWRRGRS